MPWVTQLVSDSKDLNQGVCFRARQSHFPPCLALTTADTLSQPAFQTTLLILSLWPTSNPGASQTGLLPGSASHSANHSPNSDPFPGFRSCHHLQAWCAEMLEPDLGADGWPRDPAPGMLYHVEKRWQRARRPVLERFAPGLFCNDNWTPQERSGAAGSNGQCTQRWEALR